MRYLYLIILLTAFAATSLQAQLSPGELAKGHANLEGMRNCTQCHEIGEKVSNQKCLDCHKELKSRVNQGKGYHVSREVKGKDCASCHNDHHGRDFDLIRVDKNKFNHDLTGYGLKGGHKNVDCKECHKQGNLSDPNLKKKQRTYLGLKQDCQTCHSDYHQGTLAKDCASCHTVEAFSPANNFDHNKSKFALVGKHKEVKCIDCHKKERRNGQDFQVFKGIEFANCSSCHDDPHNSNLGTNCKECHVEQSFTSTQGLDRFNHGSTAFALKGKHKKLNCSECHKMGTGPLTIFQDRKGVANSNCIACHKDIHENKFGKNCSECHSEETFRILRTLNNFNHKLTAYALEGKHEAVDCKKCHTSQKMTDPLPHNTCAACHEDFHESQFKNPSTGLKPDCATCHTVQGFAGSLYSFEDHNKTKFPLEGAHGATPCFACHKKEEKWKFRQIGERCIDCHKDVHQPFIEEKYYPKQACESCHNTTQWQAVDLDHKTTGFELAGKHSTTNCMACHGVKNGKPISNRYENFGKVGANCTDCHDNVHGTQFDKEGKTDCKTCHGFKDWSAVNFNHDNAAFKLDGKHVDVACKKCHKTTIVDNTPQVIYKIEHFECVDCHQ